MSATDSDDGQCFYIASFVPDDTRKPLCPLQEKLSDGEYSASSIEGEDSSDYLEENKSSHLQICQNENNINGDGEKHVTKIRGN